MSTIFEKGSHRIERTMALAIVAMLALAGIVLVAPAAEADEPSYEDTEAFDFTLRIYDESVTVGSKTGYKTIILNYSGDGTDISLAGNFEVSGKRLMFTSIANGAFKDSSICSIALPQSLTDIGSKAFSGCTSLQSIDLCSVSFIGDEAFKNCTSLESADAGDSLTYIGDSAFEGCKSLSVFDDTDSMASLTTIGEKAFYGCSALAKINIPETVTDIGDSAFSQSFVDENGGALTMNAENLAGHWYLNDNGTFVRQVGPEPGTAITEDYVTYAASETPGEAIVTAVEDAYKANVLILDKVTISGAQLTVTSIAEDAANDCDYLNSVYIPSTVTSIGDYAFKNCYSASISLPETVTSIGKGAFYGCKGLTSLTIPSAMTVIPDEAFYSTGIASLTIPSTVVSVGASAFESCKSLESLVVESPSTAIGSNAFSKCSSLKNVTLPDGLKSIPDGMFNGCSSLESLDIPSSVESIGAYALAETALENLALPSVLGSIGEYAFSKSALVAITIPSKVGVLGAGAFNGCGSLETVDMTSVKEIKMFTFNDCDSLKSLDLSSVTTIGSLVFNEGSLESLTFSKNLESVSYTFAHTYSGDVLFFHEGESQLSISVDSLKGKTFIGTGDGNLYRAYTMTWNDENGDLIETTLVQGGQIPSHEAPENESGLVFVGWDPEPVAAVEDAVYVAVFADSTTKYSVKIVTTSESGNAKTTTLKLDVGTRISAEGTTLTVGRVTASLSVPEDDERYAYSFSGWTVNDVPLPENGTTVKGDTVIAASVIAEEKEYEVTIVAEGNGTVSMDSIVVPYRTAVYSDDNTLHVGDEVVTATPASADYSNMYVFEGWDLSVSQVKSPLTVTATFKTVPLKFTVDDVVYFITGSDKVDVINFAPGATSATIPSSVEYEGTTYTPARIIDYVARYCDITSITIGETISDIDSKAFYQSKLVSIDVVEGNEKYASVNGVLYDKSISTLIKFPDAKRRLIIPSTVTSIEENAFIYAGANLKSSGAEGYLRYVSIPESVASIGENAFYGSTLEVLKFEGNGSVFLAENAFGGCGALNYIVFPQKMETDSYPFMFTRFIIDSEYMLFDAGALAGHKCIYNEDDRAFDIYVPPVGGSIRQDGMIYKITSNGDEKNVTLLRAENVFADKELKISSTISYLGFDWKVTSVASKAFAGNETIESLECDADIGYRSFWKCSSLQTVTFSGTSIGSYAFASCPSLKTVESGELKTLGTSAFSGCVALESIGLEKVETVGNNAFYSCYALEEANLCNAHEIGSKAFAHCTGLETVVLTEGIDTIGAYAFYDCNSICSIDIPSSVTEIGRHAFSMSFADENGNPLKTNAASLAGYSYSLSEGVLKRQIL